MLSCKTLIILVGFMGTGKSTVGKLLAQRTGFDFVDLDDIIEKEAGLKIANIFKMHGETHFRKLESNAVQSLGERQNTVVATGGGVVLDVRNMEVMKEVGWVIALDADPDTLWRRLKFCTNRPMLQSPDPRGRMEELYLLRRQFYRQAHCIVDTEGKDVEQVVEEILRITKIGIKCDRIEDMQV